MIKSIILLLGISMNVMANPIFAKADTPNNFLVCPEGQCNDADKVAPIYAVPANVLAQTLHEIFLAQPRTVFIEQHDYQAAHYVQRTKWFRFPDDIWLQVVSVSENTSTLYLYSKARYGYYDFNVNKERVLQWLSLLDSTLGK